MPDTQANLKDAAEGENFEWTDMYARMAKEARKPPQICPVCDHPQSFFELKAENY